MAKDQRPRVMSGGLLNAMQLDSFPEPSGYCGRVMFHAAGIGIAENYGIVKYRGQFHAVEKQPYVIGQCTEYRVISSHRGRSEAMQASREALRSKP